MLKRNIFTITFVSWMVFVTLLSLISFDEEDAIAFTIPHLDKVVHFTFYFVAMILGCLFFREKTLGNRTLNKVILIVIPFIILYGIIIEVLQWKVTVDRDGDVYDALANSFGAFMGALALRLLFSERTGIKWKN